MSRDIPQVSKKVAIIWMIIFFSISYYIFAYTPESRSWWVTAIAFVSSFLALGSFLELFKKGDKINKKSNSKNTILESNTITGMSKEELCLLEDYGNILDNQTGMVYRESDLPASKSIIRSTLEKALKEPSYQPMRLQIEQCLVVLDVFVPDEEFESTNLLVKHVIDLATKGDESRFEELYRNSTNNQRKAIDVILNTVLKSLQQQKGKTG